MSSTPSPRYTVDSVVFVSGHLDVSVSEFVAQYVPELQRALAAGASFVVCDARGADRLAHDYLVRRGAGDRTTVYHMFTAPRVSTACRTVGGFTSDGDRDAAATRASTVNLAWVRPGREQSGTAQNLARRHALAAPSPAAARVPSP